ncbi:MAG: SH3 domain-containing protein [Chloroflexota bacterium]|nr:SH3 domain-containing protein [Chloroflexota bacterium]
MTTHADDPISTGGTLDRRIILKASAAVAAMAIVGAELPRPAAAQAAETAAETWVEADNAFRAADALTDPFTLEAAFPFYAVGAHWSGEVSFPVLVELAFSADGETFTDAVTVAAQEEDAGRPDRNGRYYADLAFAGGARFVRYRTLDGNGQPAAVAGFSITYIDASPGPAVETVYAAALEPSVARPPIISRAAWGANEAYRYDATGEIWTPEYQTVEHVIIHHTETTNFQDPLIALRSIYYYHAVTRGWGDIGYNYLVDYLGNVYEGRAGGENVIGGHAYQYAEGSSGIGTIGNFSFVDTTPEAQTGIVWITSYAARNLDPLASKPFQQNPDVPTICSHRDVNQTSCPGDFLYDDLATIRQYAAAIIDGGANPAPPPGVAVGSVVTTIVTDANLRTSPGTGASIKARLTLGTRMTITDGPVTNGGYTWYQVQSPANGLGWVASIVFGVATSTPTPAPTPPVAGAFRVGDGVSVATDSLNLRSAPSVGASVVTVMPSGTTGTVLAGPRAADGFSWYQIQTRLGTGWCVAAYLAAAAATPPPPPATGFPNGAVVTVNTDGLNLRAQPSTTGTVLARLPRGAVLTVTGTSRAANGYTWYPVTSGQYGGGWAAGEFLALSTQAPVPAPDPTPPAGTFPLGTALVTTSSVNMRSGPSLGRSVIAILPANTRVEVTSVAQQSDGYRWYGVFAAGYGGGWCVADFLAVPGGTTPRPTPAPTQPTTPPATPPPAGTLPVGSSARVIGGSLNLRSGPSITARVLSVVPDGTIFTITGAPTDADGYRWYPVTNRLTGSGYCAGTFLAPV